MYLNEKGKKKVTKENVAMEVKPINEKRIGQVGAQ